MFAFGLRLKIDRANVNDTGWYSCEGFNDYGHQSTSAYLLILPGRPPRTMVLCESKLALRCLLPMLVSTPLRIATAAVLISCKLRYTVYVRTFNLCAKH